MNDYDPAAVELRTAATLLLVEDRPELKVFMMKRNAGTRFAGGMWVFPGGAVDDADDATDFEDICVGVDSDAANAALDVASKGLAYYVAAAREAFEEAGVLLALDAASREPLALKDPDVRSRFDTYRDEVNAGDRDFVDVIQRESLLLDAGQFHYVARWITPPGPPRRFDTRFFVAAMPSFQQPVHDDGELVHSEWVSPKEVLERAAAGEMGMLPPTLRMIERLAEFRSAADVVAAASADQPVERVPMNGKASSEIASAEPGWVKLKAP